MPVVSLCMIESMEIVFADDTLALVESQEAGATGLPIAVIKAARRKLTLLRAVTDDRSLSTWKSLRYEKLAGTGEGQGSVRLNESYRAVFKHDEVDPQTIIILDIEEIR